MKPKRIILKKVLDKSDPMVLIDLLGKELPLSKAQLKEALNQGSGWVKKGNSKALNRVRRAKSELRAGDKVEFYFDPALFERQKEKLEQEPVCLKKERDWSAWYKPVGVLSQGTKYGDSHSLLRFIEKENLGKDVHLIHRLDRETAGVMVVAHNKKSAKLLSQKWQGTLVKKIYTAWVIGEVLEKEGRLDYPLEGKKAITFFKVVKKVAGYSLLECSLGTGRTHQIRKHLDMYGHPIIGDNRYGSGNKDQRGLQLEATKLVFDWQGVTKTVEVPSDFHHLIADSDLSS